MNTAKKGLIGVVNLIILLVLSYCAQAQTAGSLNFSCSTNAPSGTWGDKHVLAIWIEDTQNPSAFIKTKAKYGNEDDHLTKWVSKSGKNLVDAVTGATLTTYDKRSVIWDGTDVNSNVVADGAYNVFIEMGWGRDKTNQHSVMSFTFTKSENEVQLSPAGNNNYSNVSIEWIPTVTFINDIEDKNSISVFPNPSSGKVSLNFKNSIHSAAISVENELGTSVYQRKLGNDFTGQLNIDLTPFANGLYFIKIIAPHKQYSYKVFLNK